MQFFSEIINVRDDVFSLDFSDGFTLSCQELNSIVLFLATDLNYCFIVLYACTCIFVVFLYFLNFCLCTFYVRFHLNINKSAIICIRLCMSVVQLGIYRVMLYVY